MDLLWSGVGRFQKILGILCGFFQSGSENLQMALKRRNMLSNHISKQRYKLERNCSKSLQDILLLGCGQFLDTLDPWVQLPVWIDSSFLFSRAGRKCMIWICAKTSGYTLNSRIVSNCCCRKPVDDGSSMWVVSLMITDINLFFLSGFQKRLVKHLTMWKHMLRKCEKRKDLTCCRGVNILELVEEAGSI